MLILIYDSDGNTDVLKIFFEHGKPVMWEIQKGGVGAGKTGPSPLPPFSLLHSKAYKSDL